MYEVPTNKQLPSQTNKQLECLLSFAKSVKTLEKAKRNIRRISRGLNQVKMVCLSVRICFLSNAGIATKRDIHPNTAKR